MSTLPILSDMIPSVVLSSDRQLLKAALIDTPIGPMIGVTDQHALHLLEFTDRPALPTELKRLQIATRSSISSGETSPLSQISTELARYFRGETSTFSTRLALHGSTFTCLVWEALVALPAGSTITYAELALRVGRPSAIRATGRANGSNQIAIVIPCHRIVGSDGALTGYGGGLWRKRWLIDHEKRFSTLATEDAA